MENTTQPSSSPTQQLKHEPDVQPKANKVSDYLTKRYELVESLLTSLVSFLLIIFVLVALLSVFTSIREPLFITHNFTEAALRGIDSTFLAIILLELLHTTLSRGPISQQVQEFLVIGITSAIRHGLEIAIGSKGINARDIVIDLGLNALGVFILISSLWLIRQQTRQNVETFQQNNKD